MNARVAGSSDWPGARRTSCTIDGASLPAPRHRGQLPPQAQRATVGAEYDGYDTIAARVPPVRARSTADMALGQRWRVAAMLMARDYFCARFFLSVWAASRLTASPSKPALSTSFAVSVRSSDATSAIPAARSWRAWTGPMPRIFSSGVEVAGGEPAR